MGHRFNVPVDRLLLGDAWAPITTSLGFVEASPEEAAQVWETRQNDIFEKLPVRVGVSRVQGPSLPDLLAHLLPLTSPRERRFLFVPTRSPWTAFFSNSNRGADLASDMPELAFTLRRRALRVCAVPQTIRKEGGVSKGRFGALILTLYDRAQGGRTISLINDGGPWTFDLLGDPFPFEDLSLYDAIGVKERFTFDTLCRYLSELGVSPFDPSFYRVDPDAKSYRVQLEGGEPEAMREYSLEQCRLNY